MDRVKVSSIFVVAGLIQIILMPFVTPDRAVILLMGGLISMMIGLTPLLYYKYGGKISLSRIGEYVSDYDNLVCDEKLLKCSSEIIYEVSVQWFKRNVYTLQKRYPSFLKGAYEHGDGESENNPRYYPIVVRLNFIEEGSLTRVRIQLDSAVVLEKDQIENAIQVWPLLIEKYWLFLEEKLDKNIRWYTNGDTTRGDLHPPSGA